MDTPKETWNPQKKNYQIVLPDVTDLQIYTQDMGKRFLGWKEEATGKVYKGGTTIEREYKGKSYAIFTAQWKDLQKGETFIKDDALYKVTSDKKGKKEVTFEKLAYQTQGIQPYKIPDTVKYDGITYKATGILKDVTIQCPKEKVRTYTSLFRKVGLRKNVSIKGK